ncbi:predicted protein [Streptomyces viridosporus ATCC 14672]|uniref:Predicted protein n=2 Tax=Streptomyces viridosporus TaxID=67581 RepID=D6A7V8_STRV1|nr:predicted protein [Streptomyces viridosporus ATCC 14672]
MGLRHVCDAGQGGDVQWLRVVAVHHITGSEHTAIGLFCSAAHGSISSRSPGQDPGRRTFQDFPGHRPHAAGTRPRRPRRTCASLLAALDVHPRIAMQILRHSEIAVTMEVYTHVPSAETRRALRKLGKALGGGSKQKKEKKDERKQQERAGERSARDGRQEP